MRKRKGQGRLIWKGKAAEENTFLASTATGLRKRRLIGLDGGDVAAEDGNGNNDGWSECLASFP